MAKYRRYADFDSRFFSKVRMTTDCWEWTGSTTGGGYGYIYADGYMQKAARVSYERLVGPIGPGLFIDHLCRNRACVRPDHLEPVTNRENIMRGVLGERDRLNRCHAGHRLTPDNLYKRGPHRRGLGECRECMRVRDRKRWPERSEKRRAKVLAARNREDR